MAKGNKLTNREKEVAYLLLEGKSNKQIALELGITESTVEFHLSNNYGKLGVDNRSGAVKKLSENPDILRDSKSSDEKLMESTGEILGDSTVDGSDKSTTIVVRNNKRALKQKDRSNVSRRVSLEDIIRFLVTHKFPILLWILLIFTILVTFIVLYIQKWSYEREGEHPDEYTVGQVIQRSEASDEMVHGQFGTVPAWPAQPGYVIFENINTPWACHLYLQIRYSKYSASEVPILVYLDDETKPRAYIMPIDQGDWNKFVWTETIDLGKVSFGDHSIKFYTEGQIFGVADLDKFVLTTALP
jgi:DNA-binding CsgD family transcriptional regulator